jgi:hypothetical protein
MAIGFEYQPRISEVFDQLELFGDQKYEVIALMEKRDRELEDYLSQTVNAALDARVTATENTNTTQTTQINTLNALFAPGLMLPYGGTTAPSGFLLCDGTAVSRTTYAALFAIIGTASGAGDGSTTFNLPDMRGRFPMGKKAAGTGSTLLGTGDLATATAGAVSIAPFVAVNFIIKT